MRKMVQMVSVALLAGLGSAALVGQVTTTNRPAPIKITTAQVSPGTANTVSGEGRAEARIAELEGQLAALQAELKTQKNAIVGLQNGLKTTATKGFETAGQVSKLSTNYERHSHFINDNNVSMAHDPDGRNVIRIYTNHTSTPTHGCTEIPNFQALGKWKFNVNQNWAFQWNCPSTNGH
ncbi:hypothetical protein [Novosphingobium sp.]|uniref:hypothetical protein n=1 Tax=Novosphingobium sp. TaxID=1874826 RepID=UPI0025F0A0A7|nr:hypothetical protein [Novosphingobium sp.]MCC6924913.1 hypothetical protein [Novosphingobium sp.]